MVKDFVEKESDSGCLLLSQSFETVTSMMIFKCKCGNEFTTTFDKFKGRNKRQCNKCGRKISADSKILSLNHVVSVIEAEGCKLLNTEYKGRKERLAIECHCEEVFYTTITQFKGGKNECDSCKEENRLISKTKTTDQFKIEMFDLVGNEYELISEYDRGQINVTFRHNSPNCNYLIYNATPANFLKGRRCPICAREERHLNSRKTADEFRSQVFDRVGEEYTVIRDYIHSETKVRMKHNTCDFEYDVAPLSFLSGIRCPYCNHSKGEKNIQDLLQKHGINFVREKTFEECRNIFPLPFDFFINDRLLIEYDGEGHFRPLRFSKDKEKMIKKMKDAQMRDIIKNEFCIENGIELVRIPYWDFKNLQEIVENVLASYNLISPVNIISYNTFSLEEYRVTHGWNHFDYIKKDKERTLVGVLN